MSGLDGADVGGVPLAILGPAAQLRTAADEDALAGVAAQRALMLEEIRAHLPTSLLPPESPEQTIAAAGFLAGSLAAAADGDDPRALAALCDDLAALSHQPLFTTTLVNHLGPEGTLLVAHRLRELGGEDRDRALDAFDEALATATTSPGLDRDFIPRLTHPPGSQDGLDNLVALLGQGVFSAPMLLAAARVADASVFSGTSQVLVALSRNPAAAQQFLLAPYDPTAAGGLPRPDPDALPGLPTRAALHDSNLDALLGHRTWDDGGRALGELLAAATTDPPGADPRLSAQLTSSLVKAVASRQIPLLDPVRDSLAGIVAAHPDWFTLTSGLGDPHDPAATFQYPEGTGPWFAAMNLAEEQTFLAEVMRSEAATNTLIVGASAYLLRQLEPAATDPGSSENAGRLFAMLSRANEHQLAHAHDAAKLVPAVLGLVRAAPQGRAAKDTELAVGSFVQILSCSASTPGTPATPRSRIAWSRPSTPPARRPCGTAVGRPSLRDL
jgi:hypothetical protein